MSFVDDLRNAKNANEVTYFRGGLPFSAQWSDLVEYREKANHNREVRWDNPNLSITFEIPGSPLLTQFDWFKPYRDALIEVWGDYVWDEPATIMSSVMGDNSGLGTHSDICPQIHWNLIGYTLWEVGNKTFLMNPGDVIFIPTAEPHSVRSLSAPRAGIAYSIKNEL